MSAQAKTTADKSAARREQAAALHESITAKVAQLTDTDAWAAYLTATAAFHSYSFNNVMLIFSQAPDASLVAGFRKWQQLGRQVRKGEKSIKIFGYSTKYVLFCRSNPVQRREVLLQLREGTGFMDGYWAHAAAGHVELGESALDAAVREAAEELGVELLSSELKPPTVLHRRRADGSEPVDHRVDFFYECRTWSGEPRRMEPLKSADLRWWPVDELPEKLVGHERFEIEAHHSGQLTPIHSNGF